ncbi:MAG: hypothetical protein ACJA1H_003006 [Glaciecola sp.]|jgi:hypothetical protein
MKVFKKILNSRFDSIRLSSLRKRECGDHQYTAKAKGFHDLKFPLGYKFNSF